MSPQNARRSPNERPQIWQQSIPPARPAVGSEEQALRVPFFVPDISEPEIEAVAATIRSNWLTSGPKMAEFQNAFADAVGAKHAIAVNSCTAALHLSLVAAGIGPGDEVIVPSMTFAATAATVLHVGARPVLVDVEPGTFLIDPAAVDRAATPRTRAVIPVHYGGQPCEMETLEEIASRRDMIIIEDAAHAFPADYRGRSIGSSSNITCFSFYANKTLTTGEGGMLTTSDDEIAERVSRLRLHGLNRQAWERFSVSKSWDYDIAEPGYKYNLTDIASTIGLGQLARSDEFWKKRQLLAEHYRELLGDVPGVEPLEVLSDRKHAWHLFVVQLDPQITGVDRDTTIDRLNEAGVGTSVHYRPLHLHSYYREVMGYRPEDFPVSTAAFDRIISLPLYPGLDHDLASEVIEVLADITRP